MLKVSYEGHLREAAELPETSRFYLSARATWLVLRDPELIPGTDVLSDLNPPPYPYTLDAAADVPYYVTTFAGAGKYPYVNP